MDDNELARRREQLLELAQQVSAAGTDAEALQAMRDATGLTVTDLLTDRDELQRRVARMAELAGRGPVRRVAEVYAELAGVDVATAIPVVVALIRGIDEAVWRAAWRSGADRNHPGNY